ncbi:MAG: glycosyltransferase family protein [Thermoplasmatota archaeon]
MTRSPRRAIGKAAERIPPLAARLRRMRGRQQETAYLRLREGYYERGRGLLGPEAEAVQKQRLDQRWRPRRRLGSLRDAHVVVLASDDWESTVLVPDLQGALRTSFLNMGPYLRGRDFRASGRARLQREILEFVHQADATHPVDLVFAYGHNLHFAPETLRTIEAAGIPVALLCLDDRHSFDASPRGSLSGQRALLGSATVHVTDTREALRWYRADGQCAYYMAPGCRGGQPAPDPDFRKRTYPVSFIGEAYGLRGPFVARLREAGIPITCWGRGWPNGPLPADRVSEVMRQSLISLGMGWIGQMPRVTSLKGRDFDAPATGTLYMTTYDFELAQQFDIGKEIACYLADVDAVEQLRYFLANPDEAIRIGMAGRRRALREHTWANRIAGLLGWLGVLHS